MAVRAAGIQDLIEFDDRAKAGNGFRFIIGIDEAGRGPLAGPVVAAAVLVRAVDFSVAVGDSKALTHRQRVMAFEEIQRKAFIGVGMVSEQTIDEINILRASHMAMEIAANDLLAHLPDEIIPPHQLTSSVKWLIDGNMFTRKVSFHIETIVKGDAKSLSIACASIIAKVTRDRIMDQYHEQYPQYGFRQHKGYPTVAHKKAIADHGLSPIHRRSFHSI